MSPDENGFRQNIYDGHKEHFDHLYRLHQLAQDSLRTYRGFTSNHYQAALVLIFPKAYKSFDSVRRLCEVASCEDAAIVLRSLLNLLAVTRWITLDPLPRAMRYFAWYWVDMQHQYELHKDFFPPAWVKDVQQHYDSIKHLFEYKDKKGRTRMAKQWYEPQANTILDLFKQVDLEKQYVEGYRPLSGIEHSDATAYFAMIAMAEKQENGRKLEIQSDLFVPHYLRNAFQYFGDIFKVCNKGIPLTDNEKLEEIVSAGMSFYEIDMRARGIAPF
jgi:hypothetical protein